MDQSPGNYSDQKTLLKAEIVTPEGVFYNDKAYMIILPGSYGEFGVLPGHVPLVAGLDPGIVVAYDQNMKIQAEIFVASGFAEVTESSIIILVEEAAGLDEFTVEDMTMRLKDLNEDLGFSKTDTEAAIIKKDIKVTEALLTALVNRKPRDAHNDEK